MSLVATLGWARVGLVVLLAAAQYGCRPIGDLVAGREFECVGASDVECRQVDEFTRWVRAAQLSEFSEPIARVRVVVVPCDGHGPQPPEQHRCWHVLYETKHQASFTAMIFEFSDGSLRAT